MTTQVLPQLQAQIEASATILAESKDDSLEVAGADNVTLVKFESELAQKMRAQRMVLFPKTFQGKEYLVCITKPR